jgi:hypothetical protein
MLHHSALWLSIINENIFFNFHKSAVSHYAPPPIEITRQACYVQHNIMARPRNHFAVETQQCILYIPVSVVVIDLHVTVKYTINSAAKQCFHCRFMSPAIMHIICTTF